MKIFWIVLVAFVVAFLGMALGVICRGRCLKGTCGGLSSLLMGRDRIQCDACCSRDENDVTTPEPSLATESASPSADHATD